LFLAIRIRQLSIDFLWEWIWPQSWLPKRERKRESGRERVREREREREIDTFDVFGDRIEESQKMELNCGLNWF
jgi:hypothetical protein